MKRRRGRLHSKWDRVAFCVSFVPSTLAAYVACAAAAAPLASPPNRKILLRWANYCDASMLFDTASQEVSSAVVA